METPDQRKGPAEVGQPGSQLPQGAASQMAGADITAPTDAEITPSAPPMAPLQENPPQPYQQTDQNKFLYGPTARPSEHIMTGQGSSGRMLPPKDAGQWAEAVRQLAADPTAPPSVRAIYAALVDAATRG